MIKVRVANPLQKTLWFCTITYKIRKDLHLTRGEIHFMVGMTNSEPPFVPEGQREVTVLVLV
jgi:hypothetical protein